MTTAKWIGVGAVVAGGALLLLYVMRSTASAETSDAVTEPIATPSTAATPHYRSPAQPRTTPRARRPTAEQLKVQHDVEQTIKTAYLGTGPAR